MIVNPRFAVGAALALLAATAQAERPKGGKPHSPKASAIPAGQGWSCAYQIGGPTDTSFCKRTAAGCEAFRVYLKDKLGETFSDCAPRPVAACFTSRDRLSEAYDVFCASDFTSCEYERQGILKRPLDNDDVSDCGRVK